jgi:glyoxylase-like metal-dependent hydrolase (beta-lactamase superfamily II)
MDFGKDAHGRGVTFDVPAFRVALPWGKSMVRRSLIAMLGFERKVLVNTGSVETWTDLERILVQSGASWSDLDGAVFTSSFPWNIGAGAMLKRLSPDTEFFAHPRAVNYIENTARQEEERPVYGFYKLVAGNIHGIAPLADGGEIDLGGETVVVRYVHGISEDTLALYLVKRKLLIVDGSVFESEIHEDTHAGWMAKRSLADLAQLGWKHLLTSPGGLTERAARDLIAEKIAASNTAESRMKKAG